MLPYHMSNQATVLWGALSGMDTAMRENFDHATQLNLQKGSKVMFGAFYDLMLLNWCLKFSLLAFYARLT